MPFRRYTARNALSGAGGCVPQREGGWRVRRSVLLLAVVSLVLVLLASGVALALTINCDGGKCVGTTNKDSMYGSSMRDTIFGLKRADLMRGNGGADTVNGDGGRDRLSGGKANDVVNGGDDADLVAGNRGFDGLNAGNGDDRIEAVDGMTDQIRCGFGSHDIVVFDAGIDRLRDRNQCEVLEPR
jgi:RTX calcium-binding nonapeptide repeat (4 copies)